MLVVSDWVDYLQLHFSEPKHLFSDISIGATISKLAWGQYPEIIEIKHTLSSYTHLCAVFNMALQQSKSPRE